MSRKYTEEEADNKLRNRFWKKIDKSGGDDACWIWHGGTHPRGYGVFRLDSRDNHRLVISSRVAWIIANGHIPDGLDVCHSCDNPPCCNPRHLFLGTRKVNIQDMLRKGRCKAARLTADQVLDIRRRYSETKLNCVQLAIEFRVTRMTIYNIIIRRTWKYLPDTLIYKTMPLPIKG